MNFQIRTFALTPGGVVYLPPGCCFRSIAPAGDNARAHVEVPTNGKFDPYSVLVLIDGDDVPPTATYLGTLPPKPVPRLHFPIPPAAMARRVSPRHFYLSKVQ